MRNGQTGFTLLELLGVLLLISLGIALTLNQMASTKVRATANDVSNSLSFMIQKAGAVYSPTFTGVTCGGLLNNSVFLGTSFKVERTPAVTVFWMDLPAASITCTSTSFRSPNDALVIAMQGMSDALCPEIADTVNRLSWQTMVDGVIVKPFLGVMDPDAKGVLCGPSANEDSHTLTVFLMRNAPTRQ